MIDEHNRGQRCAHRAAVEIKLAEGHELDPLERDCLYNCSGKAYSCGNGSVSLKDVDDFNRLFHEHVPV